jgi:hypothetical protein
LENPGVDGRIILRWIFRKWDGDVNWIELAQDGERWPALVNAVMNLRVPYIVGNFWTSCKPVNFSRRTLLHGVSKQVSKLPTSSFLMNGWSVKIGNFMIGRSRNLT